MREVNLPDFEVSPPGKMTEEQFIAWCDEDVRAARDWREKYLEYQAVGVREYWVIDPMSQHVEAYALTSQGAPAAAAAEYRRIEEKDGIIRSTVLAGFYLRTAWLWPQTRPKAIEALRELGVVGPA